MIKNYYKSEIKIDFSYMSPAELKKLENPHISPVYALRELDQGIFSINPDKTYSSIVINLKSGRRLNHWELDSVHFNFSKCCVRWANLTEDYCKNIRLEARMHLQIPNPGEVKINEK